MLVVVDSLVMMDTADMDMTAACTRVDSEEMMLLEAMAGHAEEKQQQKSYRKCA